MNKHYSNFQIARAAVARLKTTAAYFKVGDNVVLNQGTEDSITGVVTEIRVRDEKGNFGYLVKKGPNLFFARKPKPADFNK